MNTSFHSQWFDSNFFVQRNKTVVFFSSAVGFYGWYGSKWSFRRIGRPQKQNIFHSINSFEFDLNFFSQYDQLRQKSFMHLGCIVILISNGRDCMRALNFFPSLILNFFFHTVLCLLNKQVLIVFSVWLNRWRLTTND